MAECIEPDALAGSKPIFRFKLLNSLVIAVWSPKFRRCRLIKTRSASAFGFWVKSSLKCDYECGDCFWPKFGTSPHRGLVAVGFVPPVGQIEIIEPQSRDVSIAHSAIDPEQQHCFEPVIRGFDQRTDVAGLDEFTVRSRFERARCFSVNPKKSLP